MQLRDADYDADKDEEHGQDHVDQETAEEDIAPEVPLRARADTAEDGVQAGQHRQGEVDRGPGVYSLLPDGVGERESRDEAGDRPPDLKAPEALAGRIGA